MPHSHPQPAPIHTLLFQLQFLTLWDSYARYKHFPLQHAVHTFFGGEAKPKEQTVTIKQAFSAKWPLHETFHGDLCVFMIKGQANSPRHLSPWVNWTISCWVSITKQALSVLRYDLSFPKILSRGLWAEGETWNSAATQSSWYYLRLKVGEITTSLVWKCSFAALFLKSSLSPW